MQISFIDFEYGATSQTTSLSGAPELGTLRYASPERKADPTRLLPSDDIYAFGVLATEILSSKLLGSPEASLQSLMNQENKLELLNVISQCLSDEVSGRYTNGSELWLVLSEAIRTQKKMPIAIRPIINRPINITKYRGVSLVNEDFSYRDLRNMNFNGSIINNCYFTGALMTNASFQDATLSNCIFDQSFLILSRFHYSKINNCSFINASLERTVWDYVDLSNKNFSGANFWGAFLSKAIGFDQAILDGANFYRNELTDTQKSYLENIGEKILWTGDYPTLAKSLMERGSIYDDLPWWLKEIINSPNGPLSLY